MNLRKTLLFCASTSIVIAGLFCSEQPLSVSSDLQTEEVACIESGTSLVSTGWLYKNYRKGYMVIDVRSATEFSSGHIPKSINIPFDIISVWAQTDFSPNGLWLELPEFSEFTAQLNAFGIKKGSKIVLVTSLPTEANPFSLAAPTRVALTLAYAGIKNVAILDGGFETWASEGKPVTTVAPAITPTVATYKSNPDLFVTIDIVEKKIGKVILIDARDAAVYNGEVVEPWASKPGHIPSAVSLPAPSLWNSDGTYKSDFEIRHIAKNVIGCAKNKDIIVYCGVGGYASTVWFALTKILNYQNVKVFDGSAQEWSIAHDMEM